MKTQLSLFLDTVLLAQITGMSDAGEDLLPTSFLWAIKNFHLQIMNPATSKRLHKVITEKQEELMKRETQLLLIL